MFVRGDAKIKGKRAQQTMSMPFGLIFSIILIVVFLVVAIIVIKHFLGLQKCTEVGSFLRDVEAEINKVWKSSSKTSEIIIQLPSSIEEVCFVNFSESLSPGNAENYQGIKTRYKVYNPNFIFYPSENDCNIPYYTFKHLNISKITENENPYCIENSKEARLKIKKGFYESLVSISRG